MAEKTDTRKKSYTARYWPVLPFGMLVIALTWLPLLAVLAADGGLLDEGAGAALSTVGTGVLITVLCALGAYFRLGRAVRNGGVMVRVNAEGVLLAGRSWTTAPQFVPWEDVADVVLWDRPRAGAQFARKQYVGVRVRHGAEGDFRGLRRKLRRVLSGDGLGPETRERVEVVLGDVRDTAEGVGVAAFVFVQDGFLRKKALKRAVAAFAPEVKVIDVGGQGDPGGRLGSRREMEDPAGMTGVTRPG
ncbi:hypothetical protein [Spirillospora sp. NPDC047279]|uniref:hypothetical protein n=1 Tax=Spirillospora sp. NPDC047279 TaxID=3155478 RepID=UPI0033F28FE4